MKVINNLRERQLIALGVLKEFKSFCDSNKIDYMLAYGTLLGAVRHKGFIPWDDDVDVMMTRPNFLKFISLFDNNQHPYCRFISMFNDNRYFAPLAKIYDDRTLILQKYGQREFVNYGIYVDIFIIDNIPDDSSEAERLYKKAERIRKYWGYSIKEFNAPSSSRMKKIARIPVIICHRLVGYKHYLKQYDKIARSTTNSSRKGVIIYGEGVNKESFDSKMFESTSIVTFEGEHFKAPCCPDLYLHQMYGDYLKLPPENERKYHPSVAYWK